MKAAPPHTGNAARCRGDESRARRQRRHRPPDSRNQKRLHPPYFERKFSSSAEELTPPPALKKASVATVGRPVPMHLLGGVTACAAFGGASFPQSSSRSAVRMHQPSQHTQPPAWLGQLVAPALIAGVSLLGGADAALAKEMTPDQELVAQAWYKTNLNFVDRSFADQDWFSLRQKMVKKKYDSRDEAYVEIRSMLATLDDKYTRFLTPSMFKAIYAVATGDVAGIGVELAAVDAVGGMTGGRGSEGADVKITAIVEGAPSEKAGLQIGDVLVDADGNNLAGLSPEEAAAKVRAPMSPNRAPVAKPLNTTHCTALHCQTTQHSPTLHPISPPVVPRGSSTLSRTPTVGAIGAGAWAGGLETATRC